MARNHHWSIAARAAALVLLASISVTALAGNVSAQAPAPNQNLTGNGVPVAHPRIYLVNGRLGDLRNLACFDATGTPIPGCTRSTQAARSSSLLPNTPQTA